MTDTELDSALSELTEPQLPIGLRTRTLAEFTSRRVQRRRFAWRAAVAAVLLCAATVGALQRPEWRRTYDVYSLPDGNRLVARMVYHPRIWNWNAIMVMLTFHKQSEMRDGEFKQALGPLGEASMMGYRMQPRPVTADT